ncbi:MAG: hypothetical protein KIG74_04765 [Clostridiaceae bacterium]|nr:hypothetical protein [Clostridiaceae bacterium]
MGVLSKFFLKASDGEHVETVVRLAPDSRGILTGRVLNDDGKPAADVCVLLYDTMGKQGFDSYVLIDSMFTDAEGAFILGPVTSGSLYAVYVYSRGVRTRQLELKG